MVLQPDKTEGSRGSASCTRNNEFFQSLQGKTHSRSHIRSGRGTTRTRQSRNAELWAMAASLWKRSRPDWEDNHCRRQTVHSDWNSSSWLLSLGDESTI